MNVAQQPPATSSAPIYVPKWAYPAVTLLSLVVGVTAVVRGTRAVLTIEDSDLTNFFFKSADYILNGDAWHMYAVRASGAYPNYNPPLSIFLMAPLLGLARALGFAANYGAQITFVSLPFLLLIPLLGYLALRALRALYPDIPEAQRLLAFTLVTLGPLTWQSIATWYHLEQPLMLCFLIAALFALQQRQDALGGVLAGLAVLSRTTAIVPLLALGVLLLIGREWRALRTFGGVGALVAAVGFAPFFLFGRADTLYSLVQWRGTAAIGGNSIWTIFAYGQQDSSLRHTIDAIARRLDFYSVVLVVVALAALAAWRLGARAHGREAWAVVSMAALAVPMLSKTNWPYYYLEPFIFLLIWEFATMHDRRAGLWRWPVLTTSFLAIAATLSQYIGLRSVGVGDRITVGVLEFGVMLAYVVLIWARLRAAKAPAFQSVLSSGAFLESPPTTPLAPWGQRAPAGQAAAPHAPLSPAPIRPPFSGMPSPLPSAPGSPTPGSPLPPWSAGPPDGPLWPSEQGEKAPRPPFSGPRPFSADGGQSGGRS